MLLQPKRGIRRIQGVGGGVPGRPVVEQAERVGKLLHEI